MDALNRAWGVLMNQWGRRICTAIGMGVTWGVAWFVAGALLARVPGFYSDLPFALLFAPLGFVSGILFYWILARIEGPDGFDRVSLVRSAGWGAASGLLLSGIIVAGAAFRGEDLWDEFLVFGPPLTLGSALSAVGSWALVRRTSR